MPLTMLPLPGGGHACVVDFWREAPAGTMRPVFLRNELRLLRKAGAATWAAVALVKAVLPGTAVSIHHEAADIRRIMRARAARANRWARGVPGVVPHEDDDGG